MASSTDSSNLEPIIDLIKTLAEVADTVVVKLSPRITNPKICQLRMMRIIVRSQRQMPWLLTSSSNTLTISSRMGTTRSSASLVSFVASSFHSNIQPVWESTASSICLFAFTVTTWPFEKSTRTQSCRIRPYKATPPHHQPLRLEKPNLPSCP